MVANRKNLFNFADMMSDSSSSVEADHHQCYTAD